MSETVVHVTTLEQWKSVLDVWFKQGYMWSSGYKEYYEEYFDFGDRELLLTDDNDILASSSANKPFIEYANFMAQQKEDNKMATYYVTQEQLDLIEYLNNNPYPANAINRLDDKKIKIIRSFSRQQDRALLRYLGGDETIEFKVKEPLYRLVGVNKLGQVVYFDKTSILLPATISKEQAFTAPLEEIEKWQTPDWNIEKAD